MKLDKVLLVIALLVIAYAIFSRFYGMPSIAMTKFRSINVLIVGNTLLLLSLYVKK